jgi:hypothetical protein
MLPAGGETQTVSGSEKPSTKGGCGKRRKRVPLPGRPFQRESLNASLGPNSTTD